jgi:hypothetical protein
MLAQANDRSGARRVGGGEAGAGQIAFGAQYGDQLPGLVVEHGQQFVGGDGVGRSRPRRLAPLIDERAIRK